MIAKMEPQRFDLSLQDRVDSLRYVKNVTLEGLKPLDIGDGLATIEFIQYFGKEWEKHLKSYYLVKMNYSRAKTYFGNDIVAPETSIYGLEGLAGNKIMDTIPIIR